MMSKGVVQEHDKMLDLYLTLQFLLILIDKFAINLSGYLISKIIVIFLYLPLIVYYKIILHCKKSGLPAETLR